MALETEDSTDVEGIPIGPYPHAMWCTGKPPESNAVVRRQTPHTGPVVDELREAARWMPKSWPMPLCPAVPQFRSELLRTVTTDDPAAGRQQPAVELYCEARRGLTDV